MAPTIRSMNVGSRTRLRFFPRVTLGLYLLPVVVGIGFTLLLSIQPGIEGIAKSGWSYIWSAPGVVQAIQVSLVSAVLAPALVIISTYFLGMSIYQTRLWLWTQKVLAPLIAVPHVAFALGFMFLVAPSGWILRWLSPNVLPFDQPPDWLILNDPIGLSLALALWLKELPFLLLMLIAASNKPVLPRQYQQALSMGYSRAATWSKIIWPQLYASLHWPMLAIIAFSSSVVDVALILGPNAPSSFAVMINQWFMDPDLSLRSAGAAGAMLLLLINVGLLFGYQMLVYISRRFAHTYIYSNGRRQLFQAVVDQLFIGLGRISLLIMLGFHLLAFSVLIIWSFAQRWRFPDALPKNWTLSYWQRTWDDVATLLPQTLVFAFFSVFVSVVLVIGCLEYEVWRKKRHLNIAFTTNQFLIYLPLILPQLSFLLGFQWLILRLHLDHQFWVVIWGHVVFVLPYLFLSLRGAWMSHDGRYYDVALTLGRSSFLSWWRTKPTMLWRPLLWAMAIGFSVSVSQYLPTLILGGGRYPTITTEAVNLAAGGDRRYAAIMALWQQLLPLLVFGLAVIWPRWIYRGRLAMRG